MKKISYFIAIMAVTFVSCNMNENDIDETQAKTNPNTLYAKTEYNLDIRDFAMAVNEVINTNKSFRKLVKEEALKKFDGDYDVLLSNIVKKQVSHNDVDNGINTPNKVKANFTVKDLFEDAFYTLNEKNKLESVKVKMAIKQLDSRQKSVSNSISLIDDLMVKYPDLQISVPVHAEDLEDESYIPPVTFITEEYDEQSTHYLPLLSEDEVSQISVLEEPERAVIVIGMNERTNFFKYIGEITTQPTSLTAQNSESGIYLTWGMTTGISSNVIGYKIYRKIANVNSNVTNYTLIGTVFGVLNREYVDVNVLNNKTYRYYVTAFNSENESEPSNYFTISVDRANAASSFSAVQEGLNLLRLTWTFAGNEYNGNLKIYKREIGVTGDFGSPIVSIPMPADQYFDTNIQPGKKVQYKLVRETSTGLSIPKYDIVYFPYRDISKQSSVFIDKIKYSDISKIEHWTRGKPEFKVKVLGVSGTTTVEISEMWFRMDNRKNNTWSKISSTYGTVTKNWKPDYGRWFDCYTFYFAEDDGGGEPYKEITLDAEKFQKVLNDSSAINTTTAVLEAVNVMGKVYNKWLTRQDEKIGYTYLNYYDDPSIECSTGSSPAGGYLTVKYKDYE